MTAAWVMARAQVGIVPPGPCCPARRPRPLRGNASLSLVGSATAQPRDLRAMLAALQVPSRRTPTLTAWRVHRSQESILCASNGRIVFPIALAAARPGERFWLMQGDRRAARAVPAPPDVDMCATRWSGVFRRVAESVGSNDRRASRGCRRDQKKRRSRRCHQRRSHRIIEFAREGRTPAAGYRPSGSREGNAVGASHSSSDHPRRPTGSRQGRPLLPFADALLQPDARFGRLRCGRRRGVFVRHPERLRRSAVLDAAVDPAPPGSRS